MDILPDEPKIVKLNRIRNRLRMESRVDVETGLRSIVKDTVMVAGQLRDFIEGQPPNKVPDLRSLEIALRWVALTAEQCRLQLQREREKKCGK